MSNQNHAASIIEVMSANSEVKKSKAGKAFSIVKLACTIFQEDGEVTVGTHDMFMEEEIPADKMPRPGFYHPRYEPRARWDSPSFSGVIVELVACSNEVIKALLQKRYGIAPAAAPAAVKA